MKYVFLTFLGLALLTNTAAAWAQPCTHMGKDAAVSAQHAHAHAAHNEASAQPDCHKNAHKGHPTPQNGCEDGCLCPHGLASHQSFLFTALQLPKATAFKQIVPVAVLSLASAEAAPFYHPPARS